MLIENAIANMVSAMGVTFDEAFTFVLFFALCSFGGFGFIVSMCWDFGEFLWRAVRWVLRLVRRLLKVHFQK